MMQLNKEDIFMFANHLTHHGGARSFCFSSENMTGARGGGTQGEGCYKKHPNVIIEPGETVTLLDTDGPGELRSFWFGGHVTNSFILRIYYDNQPYPSVEVPEAAFFGYAYEHSLTDLDGNYPVLNSAMVLVAPYKGCNCYWPMPFKKHCRVTMENRSRNRMDTYYCISGCYRELPEDTLCFHASFRQERPITKNVPYTVIDGIEGKGLFAGCSLSAGINGSDACWVEGEPKIFLDGDRWPSINYTGLEDYFGGSLTWGNEAPLHRYQTFNGAYVGLWARLGDNRQYNSGQPRFMLYRWHLPDPIYFEHDFRMTIDNLGGRGLRRDDFMTCAYWYQTLPNAPLKPLPEDCELDTF